MPHSVSPRGTKIGVRDVKKAWRRNRSPPPAEFSDQNNAAGTSPHLRTIESENDEIAMLREVWKSAPNLGVVGFLIEIGNRVRALADDWDSL